MLGMRRGRLSSVFAALAGFALVATLGGPCPCQPDAAVAAEHACCTPPAGVRLADAGCCSAAGASAVGGTATLTAAPAAAPAPTAVAWVAPPAGPSLHPSLARPVPVASPPLTVRRL
jgi:hypothetical protein